MNMIFLKEGRNVSWILAELASDAGADISPGPAMALDMDSALEETTEVAISNA